jgi:hypothetical protein
MQAFWPAKQETEAHGLGIGLGYVNRSACSAGSAHGWVDVIFGVMDTRDCAWMGEACRKAEIKN